MNVSLKPTAIEEREKNRHEYKRLLKITDKDVIPDPLTLTGWIPEQTGISQWLPTMYFDIAEYLNANSPSFGDLKRRLMTDYTEGKAYSYFDSKFLKEVKYHPVKKDSKYCILSAYCTPSQKEYMEKILKIYYRIPFWYVLSDFSSLHNIQKIWWVSN